MAAERIDVFLSYATADRERAELIAAALVEDGLSVWRAEGLAAGESWREQIFDRLEQSKAVLVLWSQRSIQSEWVRAEASIALDREKLIPALIDAVKPPVPFNLVNTVDLTNWAAGDLQHPGWSSIRGRLVELIMAAGTDRDISVLKLKLKRPVEGQSTPTPDSTIEPSKIGSEKKSDPSRKYEAKGARGKRVFIAHASADKARIGPFVEELVRLGFSVWIDKPYELGVSEGTLKKLSSNRIHYGADWKDTIFHAIRKCDRVLAFWSKDAVEGRREQFNYEVYQGLIQKKLRQCRIDKVDYIDVGFPYTFHHIADLSAISGADYHQAFQDLIVDTVRDNLKN